MDLDVYAHCSILILKSLATIVFEVLIIGLMLLMVFTTKKSIIMAQCLSINSLIRFNFIRIIIIIIATIVFSAVIAITLLIVLKFIVIVVFVISIANFVIINVVVTIQSVHTIKVITPTITDLLSMGDFDFG